MARPITISGTGVVAPSGRAHKIISLTVTAAAAAAKAEFRNGVDGTPPVVETVSAAANTTTPVYYGEGASGAEYPAGIHVTLTGAGALCTLWVEGRA